MLESAQHSPKKKQHNQKYLDRIPTLKLLDDDFFTVCFQNNIACTELLLKIILEKEDLFITNTHTQYYVDDLKGHSVRLDAFATDANGVQYNIEVQRGNSGAIPRRARYNSSLIDAQTLPPGQDYSRLPESYVIFITENDVLRKGLPIYHIDRTIRETGDEFGDGSHIIYVNASCQDDTPLGRLMEDFNNTEPKTMNYAEMADATKYFKYADEGVSYMCDFWEELLEEGRAEAKAEAEARIEAAEAARIDAEARAKAEIEAAHAEIEAVHAETEARVKAEIEAVQVKAAAKVALAEAQAQIAAEQQAEKKGIAIKNVLRMIRDGLKADKIFEYSTLPREEIEELIALTSH